MSSDANTEQTKDRFKKIENGIEISQGFEPA